MFEKEPLKIFMVEDNVSNHPLFTAAFEAAGFAVTICPYIDETFVDDVAAIKPDIISMDIMIAGPAQEVEHDGLSALGLLKDDPRTSAIPVIILTSFFEEGKVQRAKALGAADFINLQGHAISTIPRIFKRYLQDPEDYHPVHPAWKS